APADRARAPARRPARRRRRPRARARRPRPRTRSSRTARRRRAGARRGGARSALSPAVAPVAEREHREERLLRHLDAPDLLHALLPLALALQELALARDVAPVALRQHVLPLRLHRLPGDDLAADRRLDRDLEELARDRGAKALHQRLPPLVGLVA